VNRAQFSQCICHHLLTISSLCDIGGLKESPTSMVNDLLDDRVSRLLIQVRDCDRRTFLGKKQRRCPSNA
jgi:hypothetical protein